MHCLSYYIESVLAPYPNTWIAYLKTLPNYPIIIHWTELYPILIHWAELYPILIHWAEHTQLVPKTEEMSAANQNRAQKNPSTSSAFQNRVLRHPSSQRIRIEYYITRHPIKFEYYVTRVVSQSESGITSPESSRLGWRSLPGSRIESARYSLS